eukprot:GEMP01039278.1.p1 GENE.GEMP01039278.1~~GEMP01039278.1.p1  ORF type:complete len:571 (-),score=97.91 GEMP01039278.1:50-1762(-)
MLRRLTPLVLLYRVARSQNCESASAKVTVTAKFWYVEDYDTRGAADVDSVVRTYVDATNEALTNSKIPMTYKQWGTVEKLPKRAQEFERAELPNTLFVNTFCGRSACTVGARRLLKQSADVVVLLVNELKGNLGGKCAKFWPPMVGFDGIYPTVLVAGNAPDTFVHEAGHCLGAQHNRETFRLPPEDTNVGYCLPNTLFATIMAYESTCPAHTWKTRVTRIRYFSNPDVLYNGVPTGDARSNNAAAMIKYRKGSRDTGNNCVDGSGQWSDERTVRGNCRWATAPKWSNWMPCCCETKCWREDPEYVRVRIGMPSRHQYRAYRLDCVNPLGESVVYDSWKACKDLPPPGNANTKRPDLLKVETRQCTCSASKEASPASVTAETLCDDGNKPDVTIPDSDSNTKPHGNIPDVTDPNSDSNKKPDGNMPDVTDPNSSSNSLGAGDGNELDSHSKGLGTTTIALIIVGSAFLIVLLVVAFGYFCRNSAANNNSESPDKSVIPVATVVPRVSGNNARSTVPSRATTTESRAFPSSAPRVSSKTGANHTSPERPPATGARVSAKHSGRRSRLPPMT